MRCASGSGTIPVVLHGRDAKRDDDDIIDAEYEVRKDAA